MDVLFVCKHGVSRRDCFSVALSALVFACSAPRSTPSESTRSATSTPEAPAHNETTAKENPAPAAAPTSWTKTFDEDATDAAPAGFSSAKTGPGKPARWVIRKEADAPSGPNVLAQLDDDATDDRFPLAIANEPALRDLRVNVRCKTVSGHVDQACGLVARYLDENNYFITRANALEGNIRLYTVRNGKRRQLASWDGRVIPQVWHELRFEIRGDHLEVFWNGTRVLDHHDATFTEPGRAGLWTKADSVTYFDDLRIEKLP